MKHTLFSNSLIISFLFISCKPPIKKSDYVKEISEAKSIPFNIIEENSFSGIIHQEFLVISNSQKFNELYQKIYSNNNTSVNTPYIDFKKNRVVALFCGEKNSGGYSIVINRITELPDKIVIYLKEVHPSTDNMLISAITQYYSLYTIPSIDKNIQFVTL